MKDKEDNKCVYMKACMYECARDTIRLRMKITTTNLTKLILTEH